MIDKDEWESLVQQTMDQWHIPGMIVMLIQEGETVVGSGYGYRNIQRQEPVDPDTMFVAASTTKAFTSAALGILFEEGKLQWDVPIYEYIPDFALCSELVQRHATITDLLSHRTGYPRHDKVWYGSSKNREEVYDSLRYVKPNRSFRSVWQYNNLMYMVAGRVVEALSGMPWEAFIQERIFAPLKMERSTMVPAAAKTMYNHATGYAWRKNQYVEVAIRDSQNIGPAGSLHTCGSDMAKWIQFQLGSGHSGTQKILSKNTLEKLQSPVIPAPSFLPGQYPEILHTQYGLGWFSAVYRGHKMVYHVGNLDGFYALVSMLPDQKIGQVILTNMTPNRGAYALSYSSYDRMLGLSPLDWNQKIKENVEALESAEKEVILKRKKEKVSGTTLSHSRDSYEGEYWHPGYGSVRVTDCEGGFKLQFNEFTAKLSHIHYDMFLCEGPENGFPGYMTATFIGSGQGQIKEVHIPFELSPDAPPIVFRKK